MIEVTDSPHSTVTFNRPGDDSFENYLLFILILSFGLLLFLLRSEDVSNFLVHQLGLLFLVEEVTENSAGCPWNCERGALAFVPGGAVTRACGMVVPASRWGQLVFQVPALLSPVAYPGALVQLWVAAEAGLSGTSRAQLLGLTISSKTPGT